MTECRWCGHVFSGMLMMILMLMMRCCWFGCFICVVLANDVSYAKLSDQIGQNIVHKPCIWMVWRQYVYDSDELVHLIGQNAIDILAKHICMAFHLCYTWQEGHELVWGHQKIYYIAIREKINEWMNQWIELWGPHILLFIPFNYFSDKR